MSPEPNSTMFGCFPAVIVAMIFGFLMFAGVRQGASVSVMPPVEAITVTAQAAPGNTNAGRQSLTVIEKVETTVSASVPASVTLQVSGYQPDGCKFPAQVQQTRVGNDVTVKIFRIVPVDVMCTMQLNPYNDTITLEGTFESGDYTIDVNGTVVVLKV